MHSKKIYILIFAAIPIFLFLFAGVAFATYNCSLGGSYADQATCNANCLQTANCSASSTVCIFNSSLFNSCTFGPGATTYSCPLAGGSACNGSNQCTKPGTCSSVPIIPTLTFNSPPPINSGGSATLTWITTNATYCDAFGGSAGWAQFGRAANGSMTFSPSSTTQYILTCYSSTGNAVSNVATVTVNPLVPNGCAAITCNTTTCWNNISWVTGTKICADNSCAANTCTTGVCWNNLTWIAGTKLCDNGCAANTCVGQTCWNSYATVAGTKICDNGCAAITCNTTTCWNNTSWVTGTKICADNSCAANTCVPGTCWNNLTWIAGTKLCDNGCAANTCVGDTCWNSYATVDGTKAPNYSWSCQSTTTEDCALATCGQTITTAVKECFQLSSNSCGTNGIVDESFCGGCPDVQEACKACPVKGGNWREVAP